MAHPLASLGAWNALAPPERRAAAQALADALAPRFSLAPDVAGARLVAVPGGEFEMGFSPSHRDELLRSFRSFEALLNRSRPAHRVRLPAFLLGQAPLLCGELERVAPKLARPWMLADRVLELADPDAEPFRASACPADLEAAEVAGLLSKLEVRLPSESEWEYAASAAGSWAWLFGGGRYAFSAAARAVEALLHRPAFDPTASLEHPFGLWGQLYTEWVADGWHGSYQGAPADGTAWEPPSPPANYRGGPAAAYPWRDREEVLACHVTSRAQASFRGSLALRVACDLPSDFGGRG
jgi:formylglycine-generating enzyme required for sulfatase activity